MISLLQELQPMHTEHIDLIERLYIQPLKASTADTILINNVVAVAYSTRFTATQRGIGEICIYGRRND
jgi:hypothetical protein